MAKVASSWAEGRAKVGRKGFTNFGDLIKLPKKASKSAGIYADVQTL
ncbi:MAG: hypothetical protein ABIO24_03835 [Saprospiraceae bacterium]